MIRRLIVIAVLMTLQQVSAAATLNNNMYHSRLYRFNFHYPANLTPTHQFTKNYLSNDVWTLSTPSAENNAEQHDVVELPIYSTTFQAPGLGKAFYNLLLRVGVSTDNTDVKQCLAVTSPGPMATPQTVTINGVTFIKSNYSEGAMMKSLSADLYRTVHNNSCYSIEVITYRSNVDAPKDMQAIVKKQQQLANRIVTSFVLH